MDYDDFVKKKRRSEVATGHAPGPLNEYLKPFQHAIVSWALRRGRAAIFADTGLGKTIMQLSWASDVDTFRAKLEETHGDNDHAAEYRAALALIEKHAEIWTPKEEAITKATGEAT